VWTATGPDAPVGTRVRITGGEGSRLEVEPVTAERLPPG
ncbi:MAG: NfeD family protein, partial [Sphingomonadaceae bacterium]|nr:NfeD family protein [Sphingomonadaceae bacterium]